jgi:hypothetical protein
MKKTLVSTLAAALAAITGLGLPTSATAQQPAGTAAASPSPERRAAMKEKWDAMTPEQKAAAKDKARQKWDAMTPEQQAAAKQRFAEKHPRAAARMADKRQQAASAAQ